MNRVYLPLLPLPVLAVLVAVSACSKARTEEPITHVIPPAEALAAPAAEATPPPPSPKVTLASRAEDEKPSAQDVKEFERKVRK
jgi:hypothetical protein